MRLPGPNDFTGYGDSDVDIAGTGDFAAAAWVRLNKKLDIRTIVIDRETIWLGTYHNGIIGYDRETGRITEIPVHKDFGNAVVWDMVLFDRQLWCATDLGLFRTDLTGDPLRGEFIALTRSRLQKVSWP